MIFYTTSPAETAALAKRLLPALKGGRFVAFYGDMGAGKTAFISALAKAAGCTDRPSSPTFDIMHRYDGPVPFYHFDLYRLREGELYSLGFDEIFYEPGAIVCAEWCENISPQDIPPDRVEIKIIKLNDTNRCFCINGADAVLEGDI